LADAQAARGETKCCFSRNGAQPHMDTEVSTFLNTELLDHWISQWGPISWLLHTPDAIPLLDFFFWGYAKDKIYVLPLPAVLEHLKERIQNTVGNIHCEVVECV
jgi:hypothetical protein